MKYISFFAAIMLLTPTLEAGSKNCCRVQKCNPCGTGSITRWYKAKDGTLREMIPYREALSRAEDADDMEITLRGVRKELSAAQSTAAEEKDALNSELVALRKQLEDQIAATAVQKDRADKAEVAHRAATTQVAQLQEDQKKSQATLAVVEADLKEAKAAGTKLSNQAKSLSAENEKLTAQLKTATSEIDVLKQAADKSEKVVVATEDYDADPPTDSNADEDAPEEQDESEDDAPAAE